MSSNSKSKPESYFQAALAENARCEAVAVPATVESLAEKLNAYLSPNQVEQVLAAHAYASRGHEGQVRRTGHAYITHPLAVADTLADMRMDHETLMAALLHDIMEDTETSKRTLAQSFGEQVAEIVDGVSKLTNIFNTRAEAQAENFQKMAMAMAKDIRVIMVKLADRLHNMRTIGVMSYEQRKRIARETLDFYAPIANRLGMHSMKVEFEDLGFHALYPLRADRIERAVKSVTGNRTELVEEIRQSMETALLREGIDATVIGREKHLYGIYQKMKVGRKAFSEIMDMFGFRIIVDQADAAYRALGVVHNLYKPVAGRFKDYIAIPKANGYQSLHTTLFGMHGVPIEVQIRTKQMDAIADNGIAGHWLYKSDEAYDHNHQRAREWVKGLLELQQRAGNPLEFIESLKIDLFPDEVYVFTPDGDILELPKGACPIDFAYAVHTDIGNHCVACKIDRALAPLSQQLQSGQTVQIVTGAEPKPDPNWLTFAVTSKARIGVRQALKVQQRSDSISLGRRLLNRSLTNAGTSIKDLDFRRLRRVLQDFGAKKLDELLESIGLGNLMAYVVAQRLLAAENPDYEAVDLVQGGPVAIRGGDGLVINYAKCCGPVPGDQVVGHMTPGRGFVVHIETCGNVAELRRKSSKEIIPARWSARTTDEFETVLRIEVDRFKGVIAELAGTITDSDAGIEDITIEERNAQSSTVMVGLSVKSRSHLARVMRRLRAIGSVHSITRNIA